MSEVIDWSKAPEGATHFHLENKTARAAWIKKGYRSLEFFSATGQWLPTDDEYLGKMIERPKPLESEKVPQSKTAKDFLMSAAEIMDIRGKQYDSPNGERSMARVTQAFSAITGKYITESEGWLMMQILKDVRQWQNPSNYHADSAEDCVAYAALKAESLASGGNKGAGDA